METRKILTIVVVALLTCSAANVNDTTPSANCCPGENKLVANQCLVVNPVTNETNMSRLNLTCPDGMYILDSAANETFVINVFGYLNVEDGKQLVDAGKFCVTNRNVLVEQYGGEKIFSEVHVETVAIVCFPPDEEAFLSYTVTGILIIISVVFLALTVLVYALVPKLRDLQGKCTMITAGCLCIGFSHLAAAQLFLDSTSKLCVFNGYSTFFWMLATFFWMNVVAINVMLSVVFRSRWSDKKIFIAYNIYAFGAPLIFLIAAIIAHHTEGDHVKPGIGGNSCWFSEDVATWNYFYKPVAVLLICNVVLFLYTSIKLWRQTSYENVTKIRSMKYKFLLYLKLFIVMGLSWIFEIASFLADNEMVIWVIMDMLNCLQGLIFFLVLVVFRKRALRGLAEQGLRIPCIKSPGQSGYDDEEGDEIFGDEQSTAMRTET